MTQPSTTMQIPLTRPHLGPEEAAAVQEVMASGWLVQGKRVAALEARLSALMGGAHVVATSSCTTALHLTLSALGIGPGDGVIVPSYTFVATANAVLYCGATPVFADIDPDTYNLDAGAVEAVIDEEAKVVLAGRPSRSGVPGGYIRAIMPVHQVGLPCDLAAFRRLADRYGLLLVEDAAPALGATYDGRLVGHSGGYGKGVCFSMHASKAIVAGEGGFVVTGDDALAETIRSTRQHGANIGVEHRQGGKVLEQYTRLGWNARMSDMHAAVGFVQVGKMGEIVEGRRTAALRYTDMFRHYKARLGGSVDCPILGQFTYKNGEATGSLLAASMQRYLIRVRDHATRERVLAHLLASGVSARRGIQTVHREPYFVERYGHTSLPVTEAVADTSIQLPLWPTISEAEQEYVVARVREGIAG